VKYSTYAINNTHPQKKKRYKSCPYQKVEHFRLIGLHFKRQNSRSRINLMLFVINVNQRTKIQRKTSLLLKLQNLLSQLYIIILFHL